MPAGATATVNTPVVMLGPPNPAPQISALFGSPDWQTCYYVSGILMEGSGGLNLILHERLTVLLEVLGPGASASENGLASLKVPKLWSSSSLPSPFSKQDCQITLMTMRMPGVSNSDKATERDFFNSARDICEAGLSSPAGNGGLQVLGEHNNLVIFVYAKDSEYDNSFDRSHGCVRRGRDRVFYMLSQFGFFVRTCTPAEEEEAASSPSTDDASDFGTSPVGTVNAADDPEAHPASTGCMGLQPLQAGVAEILYGLKAAVKKVNGWLFRSCRSAVLEITKP